MDVNQVIKILGSISNGSLLVNLVDDVDPFFDFIEQTEFLREAYQTAQKRRARVFLEKAIKVSMFADKQTAASDKLYCDTLKWASLVADPQTFSGKIVDDLGDLGPYNVITGVPDADSSDRLRAETSAGVAPQEDTPVFGSTMPSKDGENSLCHQPSDRPSPKERT